MYLSNQTPSALGDIQIYRSLTPDEEQLLTALERVPPATGWAKGDIGILSRIPRSLQHHELLPRYWHVRFVISKWCYLAFAKAVELKRNGDWELAIEHYGDILAALKELVDVKNVGGMSAAVLYAHGYPHGRYPDTAAWFVPQHLRRMPFRLMDERWEHVLDEAKAPFVGHDPLLTSTGVCLDLAPAQYSIGENIGAPFTFEEGLFHDMALLGHEEGAMTPVATRLWVPPTYDEMTY